MLHSAEVPLAGGVKKRSIKSLREVQYIFQSPYSSLNPTKSVGRSSRNRSSTTSMCPVLSVLTG